jgi:hypothetical protein
MLASYSRNQSVASSTYIKYSGKCTCESKWRGLAIGDDDETYISRSVLAIIVINLCLRKNIKGLM